MCMAWGYKEVEDSVVPSRFFWSGVRDGTCVYTHGSSKWCAGAQEQMNSEVLS